jgi:hypothetical protein
MTRVSFALVLAGILVTLVPLAQAAPPDETWRPGLYDGANVDDVAATVSAAKIHTMRVPQAPFLVWIGGAASRSRPMAVPSASLIGSTPVRAPPALRVIA